MKRTFIVFAGALAIVALPIIATAHNAGHIFLPDGSCQNLASGRHGPLVGQDKTPLDLMPETSRDEFGVSFVGASGRGNSPVLPGFCPAAATVSPASSFNALEGTEVSYQ